MVNTELKPKPNFSNIWISFFLNSMQTTYDTEKKQQILPAISSYLVPI